MNLAAEQEQACGYIMARMMAPRALARSDFAGRADPHKVKLSSKQKIIRIGQ